MIDRVDLILIMSVNPGFGGQSFIDSALRKIEKARKIIDASGRDIRLEVDGGIDAVTAARAIAAGADVLVAGTATDIGKTWVGGAVLASLSTVAGTIEIDAPNGAVWLHITPTTLVELAAGDYVFDIELLDGTDVLALCSAESVLHLLPEITTST